MRYIFILCSLLLLLSSCQKRIIRSTFGESFLIIPGQTVKLTDPDKQFNLSLKFDEILEDSRCPTDAICIWPGEAVAAFTVKGEKVGNGLTFNISTNASSPNHPGPVLDTISYSFDLIDVAPYPLQGIVTPDSDYRVRMKVTILNN